MKSIYYSLIPPTDRLKQKDVWCNDDPNRLRNDPVMMQTVTTNEIGKLAGDTGAPIDIDVIFDENPRADGWYRITLIEIMEIFNLSAPADQERKIVMEL